MGELSISEFRSLVDAQEPTDGIKEERSNKTSAQLSERNSHQIREHCRKDFSYQRSAILNLKKGLITEWVLDEKPLQPYFQIAAAILDCLGKGQDAVTTDLKAPNWPEIIRLGKIRCKLHPSVYTHSENFLQITENRAFSVSEAARRLRNKGYPCVVANNSPIFEQLVRERMAQAIESKIGSIGALNVIAQLCFILNQHYSAEMERYLMPSRLSTLPQARAASLPINFVLQLALKQIDLSVGQCSNLMSEWKELRELATDLAAIYDVEPYTHWDLEFIDRHTLIPFLTDLALHDRLFGVRQYRAKDIGKVLRGLFNWVQPKTEKRIGWSIVEASTVAENILNKAKHSGPTLFRNSDIISTCGSIDSAKVNKILAIFTHDKNPNTTSLLPETPGTLNFFNKPLIQLNNQQCVMIDRAICASNFYESIATVIRPFDGQAQNRIGMAAELFLLSEMRNRGISVSFGKYKCPGAEGECDAVIETSDLIIFLELKAKVLTSKAQSGSDVIILLDLSKSLLDATYQANQHEIMLQRYGHIHLKQNNGTEYKLELKRRKVEKIAVTLLDFGRFQDRRVLNQFLNNLLQVDLTSVDPAYSSKFQELNEIIASLRVQVSELLMKTKHFKKPFFNCWFLSLPQLLILLDKVNSNESFKTELWKTRHLPTHSLDWYSEMDFASKLNLKTAQC